MDSRRILVSGFPDGTTKTQLMNYFRSERDSGGGDVDSIEIDGGRAIVTFEDVKGNKLIARSKNCIIGSGKLQSDFLGEVNYCILA